MVQLSRCFICIQYTNVAFQEEFVFIFVHFVIVMKYGAKLSNWRNVHHVCLHSLRLLVLLFSNHLCYLSRLPGRLTGESQPALPVGRHASLRSLKVQVEAG